MKDTIYRADAIEAVASRDETDGTVKVFTGRQVNEILSALPSAEAVQVAYICDGRRCKSDCGECFRTLDIEHARDFKLMGDTFFQQPSAEWIPCSERLPEIDETLRLCDQISEEVIGTDTYGNIRHVYLTKCGYLNPTFCTVEEGMSVNIVAWMPLPKPYKGGDDE